MQGSVRKRGKTWSYYFDLGTVDGKRKKKEKGGFKTKAAAQEALREALNEFEKCGSITYESDISVVDYFNYWINEYVMVNCKYNTQEYYKLLIKNHINPSIGNYKLRNIRPAILQELINSKYINGFSKTTITNILCVLSKGFKMAVYPYQFIKENPVQYVNLPKFKNTPKSNEKLKVLSHSEFKRIINRFPEKTSFYIPLQIGYNTGMRIGEVCALTWDDIDLDNSTIEVKHTLIGKGKGIFELGSPKTKSSYRVIKIGKTLCDILKRHKLNQKENKLFYGKYYKDSNFVCTKENGELVTTDTLKYLSRVVNYELGITYNFHSLRHTHATMLLEAGANIKDIQKRLGHSRLSTTMDIYSHVTESIEQNTVDIFESIIEK